MPPDEPRAAATRTASATPPIDGSDSSRPASDLDRRGFLELAGRGIGLAALSSTYVAGLLSEVHAAGKKVAGLSPEQAAASEDFWFDIQQRVHGHARHLNLNNGGVSPSPRIVTEALVRYIWQQEDATAYTLWQILEPQSRDGAHRPRRGVRLRPRGDRDHAQRVGVARDPAHGAGPRIAATRS